MSADIIQFIPRPRHDSERTDFPTIAFRSTMQEPAAEQADTAPCEYVTPHDDQA